MKRLFEIVCVGLVVLLCWGGVCADEVHLYSGGKYTGTITKESETSVTIETVAGSFTVNKSEILEIIRGSEAGQLYQERRAALELADIEAHYQLGIWCRAHGLTEEAKREFAYCLERDPEYARAHRALGHVKNEGRWLNEEEMRALGYEEYKGWWLSPEEAEKARERDLKKQALTEWSRKVRALARQLTSSDASAREQAEKELLEISDPAAFPAIAVLLDDRHPEVRWMALQLVHRHRIKEAAPILAERVLYEPITSLRDVCRVNLLDMRNDEAVKVLVRGLRNSNMVVSHRAAKALGELKEMSAVPHLIKRLHEFFLVPVRPEDEETSSGPGGRDATSGQAAVSESFVSRGSHIDRLREGLWVEGVWVKEGELRGNFKRVVRPNADAIEALQAITGEDFGDDAAAWQEWWESEGKEQLQPSEEEKKPDVQGP